METVEKVEVEGAEAAEVAEAMSHLPNVRLVEETGTRGQDITNDPTR